MASTLDEVEKLSEAMLGIKIINNQTGPEGKLVRKLLVTENVFYQGPLPIREIYISILLNRNTGRNVIVYSPEGGMDIEEVSEKYPDKIYTEEIAPGFGLQGYQARRIALNLGLEGSAFKEMISFCQGLYRTYMKNDATLVEINPLVKTSDGHIIAVDAKITIDDT